MTTKNKEIYKCGICGKVLVQGQWIPAFVCPDPKCFNSEETD